MKKFYWTSLALYKSHCPSNLFKDSEESDMQVESSEDAVALPIFLFYLRRELEMSIHQITLVL